MGAEFDVGASKRFRHGVDLFNRVVNAAGENGLAQCHHAIHLIAVTSSGDPGTFASGDIPTRHDSIVRSRENRISVRGECHYRNWLVVALLSDKTNFEPVSVKITTNQVP